ncbi:type II secretion system minor pseudopilin GspJ [Fretibacter rubidus]|uniref:type II secretion system minor pseudopilin GspJ n=1 Tax=Fretibacter rubidus TaxID=570162 RepID=UPI00352B025F
MSRRRTQDTGFTLVEVLIALFIFSLISVGSVSALSSAMNGKAQIEAKLDAMTDIQLTRTLMQADFDAVILRPTRDSFGMMEPYVLRGGIDNLISFTRTGRPNPGGLERRGDLQRVSYVFEDDRLIRSSLSHENPGQNTATIDRVLLNDLDDVDIVFFTRGQQTAWPIIELAQGNGNNLIGAQVTITFKDGRILTQDFELSL